MYLAYSERSNGWNKKKNGELSGDKKRGNVRIYIGNQVKKFSLKKVVNYRMYNINYTNIITYTEKKLHGRKCI